MTKFVLRYFLLLLVLSCCRAGNASAAMVVVRRLLHTLQANQRPMNPLSQLHTSNNTLLQVMAVSATQDGNGNVHPLAVSDFSAAEGAMSSFSHCKADAALNEQDSYQGHLTLVDGAPVLAEGTAKYYDGMSLARCRRHFEERLISTKNGRRDLEVYKKIIQVPRTQRALADRLCEAFTHQTPTDTVTTLR